MLAIYDSQWGGPIPGPPFFSRASWIVPELSIGVPHGCSDMTRR